MEQDIIAATALGALRGSREGGAILFRGVTYATAGRFAAPAPPAPWTTAPDAGPRDATRDGSIAPQLPSRLAAAMGGFERPQGEDCLSLTIATPGVRGARPVLVFLHGGAFISGAGSLAWYDGGRLAAEGDLVVVGVNYRLGALGFLHGDLALDDQAAALRFVARHIGAFGGDPARITLAGQSAGATSIAHLLARADVRPLIRRAILMSGAFGRGHRDPAARAAIARHFGELLDDDPTTAPLPAILAAQGRLARELARFGQTMPPFWPDPPSRGDTAGGDSAGDDFLATVGEAARGMDVMIGTTREEVHAFYAADPAMTDPPADAAEDLAARLGGSLAAARAARPDGSMLDWLADLGTEALFAGPGRALAARMGASGARVFPYRFDAAPTPRWRACHCIDLPFAFGNYAAWREAPMLGGMGEAAFERISAPLRRAITGFTRDGDPGWAAGGEHVLGNPDTAP